LFGRAKRSEELQPTKQNGLATQSAAKNSNRQNRMINKINGLVSNCQADFDGFVGVQSEALLAAQSFALNSNRQNRIVLEPRKKSVYPRHPLYSFLATILFHHQSHLAT
jgi:hypothetical protein